MCRRCNSFPAHKFMIILGRIKNKRIQVQRFFQPELEKLEEKSVEIKVVENTRSSQANRYYWGVLIKIVADWSGFTSDEVHQEFRKKFLTYEKVHKNKTYKFTKSTVDLKVSEFSEYLKKCINYTQQELELIIPEPDSEFEYPEE